MEHSDLDLSNLNVLVISHISDLAGPTEALESFLKKRAKLLALIYNPLEYCTEKKREGRLFERGELVRSIEPTNVRTTALISWITDVFVTIFNVFRLGKRYDVCIGVNGLNALIGIFFRALGKTNIVIFYTIDWVEKRFSNALLNRIYHLIDRFSAQHSDFVWNISRRIVSLREKQGVLRERNVLVPAGVDLTEVPSVSSNSIDRERIVFLGALERTKGIELVIDAWNEILDRIPDAELVVIGKTPTGAGITPYEEVLRKMRNVELKGVLPHEQVLKILPTCGIGLAPYSFDENSITKFADPSRVKDYLACGLPVIITTVPEIAFDIRKNAAGILIDYDRKALVSAIQDITDGASYERYRLNASELGTKFDWNKIFAEAMHAVVKQAIDNDPVQEYRHRILTKTGMKIKSEMSVLDIGCGDGYDAVDFAKRAKSVVGIDIKSSPVWKEHKHERLRFIESDARSLPFKDGTFDLVYMKDVVHHVNGDARRVLKEAKRVTKKGGQIVWIEANRYNPVSFLHMVLIKGHQHLPKRLFDRLARECSKSVHFSRCEAHVFPIRSRKMRYLLYSLEDIVEKMPLFKSLLSYNIAIIEKEVDD